MTSNGGTEAGTVVYQTTVTAVGEQVHAFVDASILILFGADAPAELHDISVLHQVEVADAGPRPGDLVEIGDTRFPVLAVGHVVEENLLNLGHIDFKADDLTEAKLPGDCCVPAGTLTVPAVGQVIRVIRPDNA